MIGAMVGQYQIVSKLGEGGMGIVYLAQHALIGRRAAVKVLRAECSANDENVARFFNEARSLATLKHSGLVEVYDFGYLPDRTAYIVMELLEGESAGQRLDREGKLPHEQIVQIARQVCAAVTAAHAQKIIHRDLKPDNVFLMRDDVTGGLRIKVVDFGIAKLTEDHDASFKTKVGVMMGTPLYMSPEQCRGAKNIDFRADVYSLGCLVYEMVCGQPPFVADSPTQVIVMHLTTPPAPLRKLEPNVHPALEALVMRCLQKNPDQRPQTMDEVARELDQITGQPRPTPEPVIAGNTPTDLDARMRRTGTSVPTGFTTLSSSTGERVAPVTRSRTTRLTLILAGALVAAAIPTAILLSRGSDPVVTAPAPAPAPAVAAEPTSVTLTIDSDPTGADVYRAADGVLLGKTPHVDTLPRGSGAAVYLLKLDGYDDAKVAVPLGKDGLTRPKLNARPVVVAPAPVPAVAAPAVVEAPVAESKPTKSRDRKPGAKPAAAAPPVAAPPVAAPVSPKPEPPKPQVKPGAEAKDGTLPF